MIALMKSFDFIKAIMHWGSQFTNFQKFIKVFLRNFFEDDIFRAFRFRHGNVEQVIPLLVDIRQVDWKFVQSTGLLNLKKNCLHALAQLLYHSLYLFKFTYLFLFLLQSGTLLQIRALRELD